MKKIVASVGLVALGASAVQAAPLPGFDAEAGKPWSVSATLRGFYDDNINSAPDAANLGSYYRGSFGFEVSPSVTLGIAPEPSTQIGIGYTLSYKYYEHRLMGSSGHDDLSHTFNAFLNHSFNERYQLSLSDSFVIGQEPDLIRTGNAMTTFQRIPGDNIRNYGAIKFNGMATEVIGYEIGYANAYYNYDDSGARGPDFEGNVIPSLSGVLDRFEHVAHLDGKYQLQPATSLVLGYQYREIDYIGDEIISGPFPPAPGENARSDVRNSRMHYGYVGADHTFHPDLSGSIRVGAQYTDYYNNPSVDSTISPYALASVRWTYMAESFLEVGVTHDRNATDVTVFSSAGLGDLSKITMDQESTVVYASVNQRITPKLYGSLLGQYQNSQFYGGPYNNETEDYWMAGVNVEYRFTKNFSAHAGYNYDVLDSHAGGGADLMRDLHRNRVYIGVTASY